METRNPVPPASNNCSDLMSLPAAPDSITSCKISVIDSILASIVLFTNLEPALFKKLFIPPLKID